jgi:hypothetical protein
MPEELLTEMGRFDRAAQLRAARNLADWKLRREAAVMRVIRADLDAIIADRKAPLRERLHALLCRRGIDHQLARYAAELNELE